MAFSQVRRLPWSLKLLGLLAALLSLVWLASYRNVFDWKSASLPAAAIWDETLHLLTTIILLAAIRPRASWRFIAGAILGSTLIDLDHVPALLGSTMLTGGTMRPYTHSLTSIVLVLGASLLVRNRWRPLLPGIAFGLASHFARDMATGGLSLYWPLSDEKITYDYDTYALLMIVAVLIVGARALFGGNRAAISAPAPRNDRPDGPAN